MKVTAEIEIKAPIEKVWDVFTDFKRLEQRIDGIKKMEWIEKGGNFELGMKWRETRIMLGKEATEVMWITEINRYRNYVVEAESHGVHYRSEYKFVSEEDVTKVSLEFVGEPVTFMAKVLGMMFAFMSGGIRKVLVKDMEDLKRVCENNSYS